MRDLLRRAAAALTSGDVRQARAERARVYRLGWTRAYRSAAADILTGQDGAPRLGAEREWVVHQWLSARADLLERVDRA
jgi:hypothetical protein